MGKLGSIKGVTKTLLWMTKEEWNEMDRKFLRVAGGILGFTVMALFWFYFLRPIMPF